MSIEKVKIMREDTLVYPETSIESVIDTSIDGNLVSLNSILADKLDKLTNETTLFNCSINGGLSTSVSFGGTLNISTTGGNNIVNFIGNSDWNNAATVFQIIDDLTTTNTFPPVIIFNGETSAERFMCLLSLSMKENKKVYSGLYSTEDSIFKIIITSDSKTFFEMRYTPDNN